MLNQRSFSPVADFIEATYRETEPARLNDCVMKALKEIGFPYLVCADMGGKLSAPKPLVMEYPIDWQKHYFDSRYIEIDPVVTRAAVTRAPYHWGQLTDITQPQRLMFNEAKEAGLVNGVSTAIHGPGGEVFISSAVSDQKDVDMATSVPMIGAILTQFKMSLSMLSHPDPRSQPAQLTARERECLTWSALGKTSWDIGVILSISENTVNFHIKNAMRKLDAGTRTLAIMKAIRMGIVLP